MCLLTTADSSQYCTCKLDVGKIMIYCDNRNCEKCTWDHLERIRMKELLMMTGFVSNSFAKNGSWKKTTAIKFRDFFIRSIWRDFSRGFEQYGQGKCGQNEWWILSDYTLEIWCLNENVGNTAKVSLLLTIKLLILNCSGFNEKLNCVSDKIVVAIF